MLGVPEYRDDILGRQTWDREFGVLAESSLAVGEERDELVPRSELDEAGPVGDIVPSAELQARLTELLPGEDGLGEGATGEGQSREGDE